MIASCKNLREAFFMDPIAISIVMPVFNEAKYLAECLDSVIKQDILSWELLVVDDFSTDQSWDILKAYAARDSRIKIFKNDKKGIIPALQKAYASSSGKYITRMDADDRMSNDRLSSMYQVLHKNKEPVIAVGQVKYYSASGISDGYDKYQKWLNQLTATHSNFEDIYKECVIPSPCWMTSRTHFENCGAFKSDSYPEDYDLAFRFYLNKSQVIGVSKVLHHWRDYPSRSSRTDPHYSDNRFLHLKMDYFLKIDWNQNGIVLWGAGKKGKWIAQELITREIPFQWICNNPKKIGKEIYSVVLKDSRNLKWNSEQQVIITVASKDGKPEVENTLKKEQLRRNKNYFWFC